MAQDSEEAKLRKLRETIEALQKELSATKGQRDALNQSLESTEKNIGTLSEKARRLQESLKTQQNELQNLKDERSSLEKRRKAQVAGVGETVNALYRRGQRSELQVLLSQETPADVDRQLRFHRALASARLDKITRYRDTVAELDALRPRIERKTAAIARQLAQVAQQQEQLEQAQGERRTLLASLNKQLNNQGEQLKRQRADRDRLEQLLNRMLADLEAIPGGGADQPFKSQKGQLPWPAKGRVLQNYGSTRVVNKLRWQGVLISAKAGAPVRAVHYGRVVFSDYLRGHGLLLILDHGGGYMSLYAHNQSLQKDLGEWVARGDVIARVGNSGGQQNTALYFELRYRGRPTDPRPWLQRA